MTRGTVEEVIADAGLTTWVVRGRNLMPLQRALEHNPAISSVAPWGGSLHISGTNAHSLADAIAHIKVI